MRKVKILIIGSVKSENNKDLLREIKKQGHEGRIISQCKLVFNFDGRLNNFKASLGHLNLDNYDIFIFRGYNKNRVEAQIIAERMLFLGKVVLDEVIGKNFIIGKMYEASEFAENNVNHISTFEVLNFAEAKKVLSKMRVPFLIKANDSRKGRGIFKFESKQKALDFLKKNPRGYLIQEYVPVECDYRVMVVGGKALGAFKRYAPKKDFRTNIFGTKNEPTALTKELAKIAETATKAMNYNIAGVDVLEDEGKFRIIEVNIAPEWQRFKKVTGVNPAEHIIKYALKRFKQQQSCLNRLRHWILVKILPKSLS